jgi:hypothetical protein
MSCDEFTRKAQVIQAFLEKRASQLGQASGLVQRERKLTGDVMAKMLVIGCLETPGAKLNDLADVCNGMGIRVSTQAINERINRQCVVLMERLLGEAMGHFYTRIGITAHVLSQFSQINLLDSTQLELPARLKEVFPGSGGNASLAALKLQVSVDYLRGQLNALEVGAANVPDQRCPLLLDLARPESLSLFDLGYHDLSTLAVFDQRRAYFLTRFHHQVNVYARVEDAEKLDLVKWLREATDDQYERQLFIGAEERVPVRVLFQRCAPEVAQQRRRQAHQREKKHGWQYSQAYYAFLDWHIVITNVPATMLSAEQVFTFYRVRWQIELMFKTWKSQAGLDQVPQARLARIICQLYANLIGFFIFYWLVAPYRFVAERELSLPKAFSLFRRRLRRFVDAILYDWSRLPDVLRRFADDLARFALKDKRKKEPSTFTLLVARA